ncbi:hypothetical protein GCM10023187_39130 [Nibrella viscosa]|uniref:TonB-dependent receptor n=1 Tax=Nibrella viscosa TaxID=1084524 RepID=A0ABP8KP61_9BACT
MMKNSYLLLSCLLYGLVSGFAQRAWAQGICGDYKLKEAKSAYDEGSFSRVFSILNPCLSPDGFSSENRAQAYKLVSLTYLAIDSTERASQSIEQMLSINPNYEPEGELMLLPNQFRLLVNMIKQSQSRVQVTSVSKKPEDLYKAPATVLVLTEEEIRRRGYTDLEILFNDLPGFDVSRTYGLTYSNIYQRGYRSDNTERTLFMINGIEENDFWGNFVYWSTQIPISNIKRIEVVYGPASTIYGANAFLGVVNIITKTPKELLTGRENFMATAHIGAGSYNTRYAEVTTAAQVKAVSFSLTWRGYYSNLHDLSRYPDYNYSLADYDTINYARRFNYEFASGEDASRWTSIYGLTAGTPLPYFLLQGKTLTLTEAGLQAVRAQDKKALQKNVNGAPIGFSNLLKTAYIRSTLSFGDFTLGFQFWRMDQGSGNSANDNYRAGAKNGSVWVPAQSLFYGIYSKDIIKDKLSLTNTAQIRTTKVDDESRSIILKNYSNQTLSRTPLPPEVKNRLAMLSAKEQEKYEAASMPLSVLLAYNLVQNREPYWEAQYFFQNSNQFRNELRIIASPTHNLDIIGGVEGRVGILQGDYKRLNFVNAEASYVSAEDSIPTIGMFRYRNLGAFVQGTYSVRSNLQLVLGGRYDYARIGRNGGYGQVFNPRLAIVYSPVSRLALKAIYAEAFQDASSRDRYSTAATRLLTNPGLKPDRIKNIELAANYVPGPSLQVGISAFYANCSNIVEEVRTIIPNTSRTTLQKQNRGKADIVGVQATVDYKFSNRFSFYANATYTDAHRTTTIRSSDGRRDSTETRFITGDIAPYHVNAGVNGLFLKERLNINLRFNYVAPRPVGRNTSATENPYPSLIPFSMQPKAADSTTQSQRPSGYFEAYTLFNTTLTYQINKYIDAQLILNNLLNTEYSDPGTRGANGLDQAARTPQKGFNGMVRLLLNI